MWIIQAVLGIRIGRLVLKNVDAFIVCIQPTGLVIYRLYSMMIDDTSILENDAILEKS